MTRTALVLGGGGPVGGAWLTGVLAGFDEAGIDLHLADTVIGTSAGAVFGSRLLSGVPARELYERQRSGADAIRLPVSMRQTARFLWAALGSRDPDRSVRRLSRAALRAKTPPESDVHTALAPLLRNVRSWPDGDLRIAAVDALTGRTEVLDARSGATLPEAVAASCAVPVVWPPMTAAGRRWLDGGTRSTANLQLARGHRRVVAIAPVDRAVGPHPSATEQAAELSASGTRVILLTPDPAARRTMGRNLADCTRGPAAARAGYAQARTAAAPVAQLWSA